MTDVSLDRICDDDDFEEETEERKALGVMSRKSSKLAKEMNKCGCKTYMLEVEIRRTRQEQVGSY